MARFLFSKFNPKSIVVTAVVFLLVLITGLFFIARNDNAFMLENNAEPKKVPMPTEINANFLTQIKECFIPITAVYGYTLRISSGFRTVAEQDQLYNQGRTVNGHIVTEAQGGKSIHNFGFAVDIVDRWKEYDIDWEKIGRMAEYCGLEHGDEGDISHFEIRDGLTTARFAAGRRPLVRILPCAIMNERAQVNQSLTLKDLQNCGAPKF
ncbi:MAG: M15 family metallopeptidase [bacterium]|nr:M15 family metallopeptidase [bacterium]